MAQIPLREARRLCTDAEYRAVLASLGSALDRPHSELRRVAIRLRKLRDKWRTQATAQRRRLRPLRGGDAHLSAERSATKERIFEEALGRVERQLARRLNPRRGAAAGPPTATSRVNGGGGGGRSRQPAVDRRGGSRRSRGARAAGRALLSSGATLAAGTTSARPAGRLQAAVRRGAAGPPPGAVLAEAKFRSRIRRLTTRVRGHVLAQGRRKQARRDIQQARSRRP